MTVCEVKRNDAERRAREMLKAGIKPGGTPPPRPAAQGEEDAEEAAPPDLEVIARDQIAQAIIARFQGHGMARLVDAVLKAQGYACGLAGPRA